MADRIPYCPVKRGRRFFQPTAELLDLGFMAKPLGEEGPQARSEAWAIYARVKVARDRSKRVTAYPAGSLGSFYDHFRRTPKWASWKPRTREDYERAWKVIGPRFGRRILTEIGAGEIEDWHTLWVLTVSERERYHTMKCARQLFDQAILRLKLIGHPNPFKVVTNPQAPGRSQIWLGAEIPRLIARASLLGYDGMALAIRIAWDTLFSPVDVWTLTSPQVKHDSGGTYIERDRTKTEKAAFGALSAETAAALAAYIEALPFDLAPDAPIIRQRNGHAYRSKDTFGDDFRTVRRAEFGKDEKRQFMDIRRSGNVEADLGGADKATMGEVMANLIASNAFLDATYTPATVAKAREVAKQRLAGRALLKDELAQMRSNSAR